MLQCVTVCYSVIMCGSAFVLSSEILEKQTQETLFSFAKEPYVLRAPIAEMNEKTLACSVNRKDQGDSFDAKEPYVQRVPVAERPRKLFLFFKRALRVKGSCIKNDQ